MYDVRGVVSETDFNLSLLNADGPIVIVIFDEKCLIAVKSKTNADCALFESPVCIVSAGDFREHVAFRYTFLRLSVIEFFGRFDYNDEIARRPVLMIFSWTTHRNNCPNILARPVCIPGATSVLIVKPHPFNFSLQWSGAGANGGQWPTVQDLMSKTLGQTVDKVQYGDIVILRTRVKIAQDEIVTFLDPRHAVQLGLKPSVTIRCLQNPCEGICSLRDAAFRVAPSICDYFHWGGAKFATCDTSFNQLRVVQLRCVPGAVLSVHNLDGNVLATGPLVLLWSTRDIPAGFNLVAGCCEIFSEASSNATSPALNMVNIEALAAEPSEDTLPSPLPPPSPPLPLSLPSLPSRPSLPSLPSPPSLLSHPSKKRKLDEHGASTSTFVKTAPTQPLRNACASVRKWVVSEYSTG